MKHCMNSIRRWALVWFCAVVSAIVAVPVFAQSGAIVWSIQVEYSGPKTLSPEKILSQIRTEVGHPYNDAVVEDDIRALYKTGELQNVRIFGEPEGDGVRVIVVVQTRSIITSIEIDGAERI